MKYDLCPRCNSPWDKHLPLFNGTIQYCSGGCGLYIHNYNNRGYGYIIVLGTYTITWQYLNDDKLQCNIYTNVNKDSKFTFLCEMPEPLSYDVTENMIRMLLVFQ
jgi:hypothetical protein